MSQPIRVVVFKDGDLFVAQALEVDVSAQGKSADEAMRRLRTALRAEVEEAKQEGRDLFDLGPAPAGFTALYNNTAVSREQIAA